MYSDRRTTSTWGRENDFCFNWQNYEGKICNTCKVRLWKPSATRMETSLAGCNVIRTLGNTCDKIQKHLNERGFKAKIYSKFPELVMTAILDLQSTPSQQWKVYSIYSTTVLDFHTYSTVIDYCTHEQWKAYRVRTVIPINIQITDKNCYRMQCLHQFHKSVPGNFWLVLHPSDKKHLIPFANIDISSMFVNYLMRFASTQEMSNWLQYVVKWYFFCFILNPINNRTNWPWSQLQSVVKRIQ